MRFARYGMSFVLLGILGGVATAGCGDSTPQSPQGAYDVHFSGGPSCPIGSSVEAKVGDINDSVRSAVVVDSVDGTTVSCAVKGTGTFNVSGQIQKGGDNLDIEIDALPAGATKAAPAKGRVSFSSPQTVKPYNGDSAHLCNFYFLPGTKETVASGKVWLAFQCDQVVGEMNQTCSISESYAIFENCTTQ
jgi:hypothetical protein